MFNFTKKNLLISFLAILVLAFLAHLIFFSPVPKNEKAQFAVSKNKELSSKINKIVQKLFNPEIKVKVNIVETKSQNPAQTLKINQKDEFQINLETEYFVKNDKYENQFLKKVLSHELMHVLSLQKTEFQSQNLQNEVSKEAFDTLEAKCRPNYFNLYGCFASGSYLSKFYQKFWNGEMKVEYDQIQKINDKLEFNQKLNNWGQKNLKNFVSKTAFIDPEEDLAESFSVWILDLPIEKLEKVAKEKVLFFENLELKDFKKEFAASFDSEFGNI